MRDKRPHLQDVLSASMQRRRVAKGMSQEKLAAVAQRWGLDWSRATVAHIERGNRTLTFPEILLLPVVLSADPGELFSTESEWIRITDTAAVKTAVLVNLFGGLSEVTIGSFDVPGLRDFDWGAVKANWEKTVNEARIFLPDVTVGVLTDAEEAAGLEAEQKAAARLGVDPGRLSMVAFSIWNRSLTAEREARLKERLGDESASPRKAQALRGHVTRDLLKELEPVLRKRLRSLGVSKEADK